MHKWHNSIAFPTFFHGSLAFFNNVHTAIRMATGFIEERFEKTFLKKKITASEPLGYR